MGDVKNTGLTAVSREREDGVGRKDAGVLREGKTSFSVNKSICGGGAVGARVAGDVRGISRGPGGTGGTGGTGGVVVAAAAVAAAAVVAVDDDDDDVGVCLANGFTSSVRRLSRRFGAVLWVSAVGATPGKGLRAPRAPPGLQRFCAKWSKSSERVSLSLSLSAPWRWFLPSSAHSSAASRYAGEKDGLVFSERPPLLLASPTCSVPSTITARLAAPVLPRWPGFFGRAGLRLMLVVVVVVIGGSAAGDPSQTAGGVGPRGSSLALLGPVRPC